MALSVAECAYSHYTFGNQGNYQWVVSWTQSLTVKQTCPRTPFITWPYMCILTVLLFASEFQCQVRPYQKPLESLGIPLPPVTWIDGHWPLRKDDTCSAAAGSILTRLFLQAAGSGSEKWLRSGNRQRVMTFYRDGWSQSSHPTSSSWFSILNSYPCWLPIQHHVLWARRRRWRSGVAGGRCESGVCAGENWGNWSLK